MPVLLSPPDAAALLPVPGVRLGVTEAAIRKLNRKDLTLIELAPGARREGVGLVLESDDGNTHGVDGRPAEVEQ